jgi:hypothetical protein
MPYSQVEVYWCSWELAASIIRVIYLKMEVAYSPAIYGHVPEDCNLYSHHHEKTQTKKYETSYNKAQYSVQNPFL